MGKPACFICENKGVDQCYLFRLCNPSAALIQNFKPLAGNPQDRFSRDASPLNSMSSYNQKTGDTRSFLGNSVIDVCNTSQRNIMRLYDRTI